jgi:ectoine hydroxylase-related dioxygenase (phytanoyl-CoA dioxygenase family)
MPSQKINPEFMKLNLYYSLFKKLLHNGRFSKNKIYFNNLSNKDKEIAKEINEKGIYFIPGFFDEKKCSELRNEIDKQIERFDKTYFNQIANDIHKNTKFKFGVPVVNSKLKMWSDLKLSDIRIIGSENLNIILEQHAHNQNILAIGRAVTGSEIKFNFQMSNRVSFVENNLGSGGGWHRDNNYANGFKILVYLDDVEKANGPFEYIPYSHTMLNHFKSTHQIDQYQFTDEEVNNLKKKLKLESIIATAKMGTAVLFNTNGIHRGMPILIGKRYAVTNYYQ